MSTSPAKSVDVQKEKQLEAAKEARKEERIHHIEAEDKGHTPHTATNTRTPPQPTPHLLAPSISPPLPCLALA